MPVLARTDGFVDSIYVNDDEFAHAGDILVQLDTTDLYLQLKQALTSLAVSHTNLKRSQVGIDIAEMEKKIASQNIEAQIVSLKTSESNYERNKVLQEKGVVSVQMYEITEENFKKNQVALQNAYNKQKQVTAQLEDAKKQLELAHQNIDAQINQIAIIRQSIQYATIKAPVSGHVSKRKIQAGQMVRTGSQLFSIVQSNDLWVTQTLKTARISCRQACEDIADAYPDDVFYGIVESVGNATGSNLRCCLLIMQQAIM